VSDDDKNGNEGQEKLTRRASDRPHAFVPNKGFRTCRSCGLPKKHEVHTLANLSKHGAATERQPQSIEQLRELLPHQPPRPASRFTLSDVILAGAGLIIVLAGLVYLMLLSVDNTVDKPLQTILKEPDNQMIRASAQVDGLNYKTLVFDLARPTGNASGLDVMRPFLQYAGAMKERHFTKVILACQGENKFALEGSYFQQLGQTYKNDNSVSILRSLPPHLTTMDGRKPFFEYSSESLENVTKAVAQFTQFTDEWYARDSGGLVPVEAGNSTAVAAEHTTTAIDPSAADNWLVVDSRSEIDNTPEVSFQNAGTEGAVLTLRCENRTTEAYVDTGTLLDNGSVKVHFDDLAPIRQQWNRSSSDKALFASDAIAFTRRLATAHRFRIDFTPTEGQEKTVVFDVSGLSTKLPKIAETCDWPSTGKSYARAKATPGVQ
jgi:Type VI secretion system VasI, EvfG, VC_A0118